MVAAVTGLAGAIEDVHWLEQVHGSDVIGIGSAGSVGASGDTDTPVNPAAGDARTPRGGVSVEAAPITAQSAGTGDALVSTSSTAALAVFVADCGAVALASPEGVFAAVHAGWRGVRDGVIGAAVDAMRSSGASRVSAATGPCIHPCCYEFSTGDLGEIVDLFGPAVRGRTDDGRPALDLPAALRASLLRAGVEETDGVDRCTGCGGGLFSHRVRAEAGRQALIVWRPSAPGET